MSENNSKFSVLDMAQEIAESSDMEIGDLFKKPAQPEVKTGTLPVIENNKEASVKKPWTPDESLLEGMDEMKAAPVVYSKDELKEEENNGLKNIADDNAIKESKAAMDELTRKTSNIEDVKKRMGISILHIPEGPYQVSIFAAAGDLDYKRAQAGIEEILKEIEKTYPSWIEYVNPKSNDSNKIIDIPKTETPVTEESNKEDTTEKSAVEETSVISSESTDDVKVVLDKSQLNDVSWSSDEIEKIRKARSVVLNIVETKDLEYSQIIDDIDENVIDSILDPYVRKNSDIRSPLPASKYRATFIGLSYPEVIDLSNSQELNNIDGEWKKWSICYNHMKNPSIGPWEEYDYYIDPTTKKQIRLESIANIPSHVNPDTIIHVSKFDDFLQKTSFIDLDFMLWKILCATAMSEEIISIDCHALNENGVRCNHSYDWVYRPNDLLIIDSIDKAVLMDMEKTNNANSLEEIKDAYDSSMLKTNNTVKLTSSGIQVVFGHISAFDYLTDIYGAVKALEDGPDDDVSIASKALNYSTLTVIKSFLIPKEGNRFSRIHGIKGLMKVIEQLDEIDWQTLSELVRIMIEPYQFRYALTDIVCPKCKNKSVITIEDMSRMLFIVARSLSSVNVELKKI